MIFENMVLCWHKETTKHVDLNMHGRKSYMRYFCFSTLPKLNVDGCMELTLLPFMEFYDISAKMTNMQLCVPGAKLLNGIIRFSIPRQFVGLLRNFVLLCINTSIYIHRV